MKEVRQSRVGDTVTSLCGRPRQALGGYRHPNPMVFAGLYPIDGADYPELREALDKLQLNDAALVYEPETSGALGSASGSASSACCTWRSSGSGWSGSSTST